MQEKDTISTLSSESKESGICSCASSSEKCCTAQTAVSCCSSSVAPRQKGADMEGHAVFSPTAWNIRYWMSVIVLAALWWGIYAFIQPFSTWLVFTVFGFTAGSHTGGAVEFFVYDTLKILMLLLALIYLLAWVRASLNVEKVRDFLAGKRQGLGYFLGATFGAVTPFCSCSSIPLFLGFTTTGIPIGITMAFLITSPLINEIAVVLLWSLLGWKFTLAYVVVGMSAGIIGGFFMDSIKAGRWLQPFVLEAMNSSSAVQARNDLGERTALTIRQRHEFAYNETTMIFRRVWKWVIIGVGIGATLHGFVPQNWFAENFAANQWWTVPAAVLVAVPLYSSVTGIIPIMESLLVKGLPIGTTMAFCMGAVVASIPEFMMLRQIMTFKLQAAFIGYLWVMLTVVGWLFNFIGPYIL